MGEEGLGMPEIGEIRKAKDIGYKGANGSGKYIWTTCEICGKERWAQVKNRESVYKVCYPCAMKTLKGENNPSWKGGKSKCVCLTCGKTFYAYLNKKRYKGLFCSIACIKGIQKRGEDSSAWKGGKVKRICQVCGKEFEVYPHIVKRPTGGQCCSKICQAMNNYKQGYLNRIPNNIEKSFIELLNTNQLPFKYVGDGEVWFGNRNPDFINTNGKKQVIELFGIYWHPVFDVAQRIEHYKQYGFDCLIIWEDELGEIETIVKKVKTFTRQKHAIK